MVLALALAACTPTTTVSTLNTHPAHREPPVLPEGTTALAAHIQAPRVSRSSPPRPALQDGPGMGGGFGYGSVLNWEALRQCESGGNYHDRRNPIDRGAYQFDRSTWASVGGAGDPADAQPAEQDARAQALYDQRGRAPWPTCGALL